MDAKKGAARAATGDWCLKSALAACWAKVFLSSVWASSPAAVQVVFEGSSDALRAEPALLEQHLGV